MVFGSKLLRKLIVTAFIIIDDKHLTKAENWIKKAIEADKRNGMKWNLARDYVTYAEICKQEGEKAKSIEKLGKAIDIFEECGADAWVKKCEKELAEL